jgi:hypothetical protein
MNATTIIFTENARRYLGQFVSHFSHKLPFVRHENNERGEVEFPIGLCTLDADATRLSIIINAGNAEDLEKLKGAVERHLLRFAFREELAIAWDNKARDNDQLQEAS